MRCRKKAAKYNDYLIYHTDHVQTEEDSVAPESILKVNVTVNSPSDFITLEIPLTGQSLKIYCAENDTDSPTGSAATVLPGVPWNGRASDIGWSTVRRKLLLANETASNSDFKVTVI